MSRYSKLGNNIVSSIIVPRIPEMDMIDMNILLVTKNSIAKRVELSKLIKSKIVKTSIVVDKDDELVTVIPDFNNKYKDCILYTNKGWGIRFTFDQFKIMSPTSRGIKQIELSDDEFVVGAEGINSNKPYLFIMTSQGKYKMIKLSEFPVMKRKDTVLNLAPLTGRDTIIAIKAVNKKDVLVIYHKDIESENISVNTLDVSTRISKCEKLVRTSRTDCVIGVELA